MLQTLEYQRPLGVIDSGMLQTWRCYRLQSIRILEMLKTLEFQKLDAVRDSGMVATSEYQTLLWNIEDFGILEILE